MPTLNWIGKEAVVNHHQQVPFRLLKDVPDLACGDPGSGNLIVQGDNLAALKALLPYYAGQVKCVYIDPPYNTGNEGWAYNDNVNSPVIRDWLGKTVGKEGETLDRHDRWLCMMYPRLALLRQFLSRDGSIWISMDDSEIALLRILMDEIFGHERFVACNVWQKRYSRENREAIGDVHEYLLVYAMDPGKFKEIRNRTPLTEEQSKIYKNPNNDPRGRWRGIPMTAQGWRPNQMYAITSPSGAVHHPPEGRCWSTIEPEFKKLLAENRIYFGKDGKSQPNIIRYLDEVEGFVPWTWWPHEEVGHTDEAKKEIQALFQTQTAFDTPKPTRLLERVLQIATNPGDLVLDSFAGSGTTGHAVLKMNAASKVDAASSPRPSCGEDAASTDAADSLRTYFDPAQPVGFLRGGNLPHWRQQGATYFVTWRTADAMPAERVRQWVSERDAWLAAHPEPHDLATRAEYDRLFPERWERWLDEGHGACVLRRPELNALVEQALRQFNGVRYRLDELAVMPNHVHALVTPLGEYTLSEIVQNWKSYTSHAINKQLGRTGEFWQKESFDHIVRHADDMSRFRWYIRAQQIVDAASPPHQGDVASAARRFILVEMEPEIARGVTAERVRRVAQGYTSAKGEAVAGLGGGFRYCELGEPLFDETGMIRESVKFSELARHVYFSETGEPLPRARVFNTPFLGACRGVGIYLLYNGILGDESAGGGNVLTRRTLARLPPFDGPKVVYCAGCLLSRDRLQAARITVRQTPYEVKVS